MELLKPHDPGEDRTRRCHHHRPRSCCPTGPPTHPGQQRSPTVSITVCWWPSPRCPTRVAAVPDPRDPRGTRYPLVSMLAVAVSAVLTRWLRERATPVVVAGRRWRLVIAIDGKVERGARLPDGRQVHLLSAYDTAAGVVLAQMQIAAKSNEIPAFAPLLDRVATQLGSLDKVLF